MPTPACRTILGPIALGLLTIGCSGTAFSGPPVTHQGITITPVGEARLDDEEFELDFEIRNQGESTVVVAMHQLAVITDSGGRYYSWASETRTIPAGGSRVLELELDTGDEDAESMAGLYVRFEGIYRDGQQILVPVVALGTPTHQAGKLHSFSSAAERTKGVKW